VIPPQRRRSHDALQKQAANIIKLRRFAEPLAIPKTSICGSRTSKKRFGDIMPAKLSIPEVGRCIKCGFSVQVV